MGLNMRLLFTLFCLTVATNQAFATSNVEPFKATRNFAKNFGTVTTSGVVTFLVTFDGYFE